MHMVKIFVLSAITSYDCQLPDIFGVQLILATVPGSKDSPPPSIVTDANLKLLFDLQEKV